MKIGPKYKIARRLGERVFSKTQSSKFTISGTEKKGKGKRGNKAMSEYGKQLLEKQKARYAYGVTEKQFANYIAKARLKKGANPAQSLYELLEKRLDNVVYRLGFVNSRAFARQAVSHGHITVNGRKVTIPSYEVKAGDKISVRVGSKDNGIFREAREKMKEYHQPAWLLFDDQSLTGEVKAEPSRTEGEMNLNMSSIIEFYSRV